MKIKITEIRTRTINVDGPKAGQTQEEFLQDLKIGVIEDENFFLEVGSKGEVKAEILP